MITKEVAEVLAKLDGIECKVVGSERQCCYIGCSAPPATTVSLHEASEASFSRSSIRKVSVYYYVCSKHITSLKRWYENTNKHHPGHFEVQ